MGLKDQPLIDMTSEGLYAEYKTHKKSKDTLQQNIQGGILGYNIRLAQSHESIPGLKQKLE